MRTGQAVNAAELSQYQFFSDESGNSNGVIIRTPLVKPVIEGSQVQGAGVSDVITQVNLLKHGDVTFNLVATAPLTFTIITPQGQEPAARPPCR
jgi:hypothetical protein